MSIPLSKFYNKVFKSKSNSDSSDFYSFVRNSFFVVHISPESDSPLMGTYLGGSQNPSEKTFSRDFDFYIKTVNVPNVSIDSGTYSVSDSSNAYIPSVSYPPNMMLSPAEMNFRITFYITKNSIVDSFIASWMKGVTDFKSQTSISKNSKSFPSAVISVYVYASNNKANEDDWSVRYDITKCYPSIIDMPELDNTSTEAIMTRTVQFSFDKIYIWNCMDKNNPIEIAK